MFEAVELHRKVEKRAYEDELQELRPELLKAQYAMKDGRKSVIIIIGGVEGAGKSEVVNRLNEWLDTRWIRNHAFWDESDEERMRPYQWRFWRAMPPRGSMAVMFGSWYTQPIIERAFGRSSEAELDVAMSHIEQLERMLTDDGHLVIKFWYHLSKRAQRVRIKDKKKRLGTRLARRFAKKYESFVSASERAIRLTDTGNAPWHLIDAEDRRYRDLKTGRILLQALRDDLQETAQQPATRANARVSEPLTGKTVLDDLDVDRTVPYDEYRARLEKLQARLHDLSFRAHAARRSLVAVFEGWDAAGKGGAIRRVTAGLDARLYSVISIGAPTDEERARHYLWRFWRHLPRDGYITLYDRSWYGRVLVERVEGFATQDEWMRAYQEINDFEEHLHRHGTLLSKFWLHITPDEQLRRFEERQATPWKRYKITPDDWRNRDKWNAYGIAVTDMVARTSTGYAPWVLVPSNDKRLARVRVIETIVETLEAALDG
jgi:polyphosphate:AMP phosphotransferase